MTLILSHFGVTFHVHTFIPIKDLFPKLNTFLP